MKKIVYNNCFGGFGLSLMAQKRYLELQGKEMFVYKQTKSKYSDGKDEYTKILDISNERSSFTYIFTKDFGDVVEEIYTEETRDFWFYGREIDRKDPLLVQVVEELGSKQASGICAELQIWELEDDTPYRITEYDGNENVETQSDLSWSI